MELTTCLLCSESLYTTAYEGPSGNFVLCSECGLVYQNPRMSEAELARFYAERYQLERHKVADLATAMRRMRQVKRFKQKKKRAKEIAGLLGPSSRVLEVGAGYGMLLAAIREVTGAHVEGVEPSTIGVRVAKDAFDLSLEQCDIDSFLKQRHESYDLIVLSHVLEHLCNPKKTLSALRELLAIGGTLYIAVPNVCMPDDAPDRFFHSEQLTFFSPRTLVRMLDEAGFAVTLLEERTRELVVRAVIADSGVIQSGMWQAYQGTKEDVRTALERNRRKYAILSMLRRVSEYVLPKKISNTLRDVFIWVCIQVGFIRQ